MTPKRTLALIAAFVAITFGSFVLYILRSLSHTEAAALALGGAL